MTERPKLEKSLGSTGDGVVMADGVVYHGTVWTDHENVFVLYQNRMVPVWFNQCQGRWLRDD